MFQLSKAEKNELVTNCDRFRRLKHSTFTPYAFTEQGVAMLSSVLKGELAVQVNIAIMRAFVKLREMLSTHKELRQKIEGIEKKYDHQFKVVFEVIKQLLESPKKQKRQIGFAREKE
jgi:DNA repair protein RadC